MADWSVRRPRTVRLGADLMLVAVVALAAAAAQARR